MVFLVLMLLPSVVILVAYKLLDSISIKKLMLQFGVQIVTAISCAAICYYSSVSDTEVWNGTVVSKTRQRVSCTHTHRCNCRKDSKGNESCDQCPDHPYDVDWEVSTSNREVFTIDRIDSQGIEEPSRWRSVRVGEPTSRPHRYTNYIKGSPGTLFRKTGQLEKYKADIPEYPTVYDYYRIQRLLASPGLVADSASWNAELDRINADIGAHKQVNAMVLITNKPRDFFFALEESWLGGKKNDAILVIGVDKQMTPIWVEVLAWTDNQMFKIKLKEEVLSLPLITKETTLPIFAQNIITHYKRKPMHDFEYLKASIVPTTTQWIISILVSLLVAGGMIWAMMNTDPFNEIRNRRYHSRTDHFGNRRYYF